MPDASVVHWIREKYQAIVAELDERGRRRWAAAEARSLGWGGVAAVAEATGMSDRTIRTGIVELDNPETLTTDRQRRPGGGRHRRETDQPDLLEALERLVDSGRLSRGRRYARAGQVVSLKEGPGARNTPKCCSTSKTPQAFPGY